MVASNGTLVIAPASLIYQWEKEVRDRVKDDQLQVHVFHGPKNKRDISSHRLGFSIFRKDYFGFKGLPNMTLWSPPMICSCPKWKAKIWLARVTRMMIRTTRGQERLPRRTHGSCPSKPIRCWQKSPGTASFWTKHMKSGLISIYCLTLLNEGN